jgi:hypothetical protein
MVKILVGENMKLKKKKLIEELKGIKDFRRYREQIVYPLHEVLFISLLGIMKGYTTFDDLHFYYTRSKDNKKLQKLLQNKKIRVPSRSTLHRILSNVSYNELEMVFRNFFNEYSKDKNIAIDGKWLNGSNIEGQYVKSSHKSVLHIFNKNDKIVLGHKFMEKGKLSEIPALNELLEEKTFSNSGQIYTMDALHTQFKTLNKINDNNEYFLVKVKANQKSLQDKIYETIKLFDKPTDTYTSPMYKSEGNKYVIRTVDIFQSSSSNIILYHKDFNNIQTIIRVTKVTTDPKTNESKKTTQLLIANFKEKTPHQFHDMILAHWGVETFHYHKDMLTCEDDHICYINPFAMTILRSFTINLYQLFLNKYKDEKLDNRKVTMAEIKRVSSCDDDFIFNLFEI